MKELTVRPTTASGMNSPFLSFIIKLPGVPDDGAYDGTFLVLLYTVQRLLSDFEVETEIEITLNECRIFRDLWRQFSKKTHRVYLSNYMYMQHYKEESIYFHSSFGSQYKLGNLHVSSLTEFVLFSRNKFPGLF